jgi:UDP:flavonoid glycosyltransferase YjiC (YdhE family)
VPHGWLFPKINAALHHGGAGTTGASLRAGLPTLIKPWFGDQNFWAIRVTKLEVGMKVASLRSDDIADALRKATQSTVMIEKAARIGERIRSETGVNAAVSAIHANLIRAAQNRQALKREDAHRRRKVSQEDEQDSEDAAATPKKADRVGTQGSSTSSFSLPPLPKVTLPTLGCK